MDSTEPDHLNQNPEDLNTKTYLGSFRKVRNAYPLMTVGGVYDHQRETTSDKRVFILTRSVSLQASKDMLPILGPAISILPGNR